MLSPWYVSAQGYQKPHPSACLRRRHCETSRLRAENRTAYITTWCTVHKVCNRKGFLELLSPLLIQFPYKGKHFIHSRGWRCSCSLYLNTSRSSRWQRAGDQQWYSQTGFQSNLNTTFEAKPSRTYDGSEGMLCKGSRIPRKKLALSSHSLRTEHKSLCQVIKLTAISLGMPETLVSEKVLLLQLKLKLSRLNRPRCLARKQQHWWSNNAGPSTGHLGTQSGTQICSTRTQQWIKLEPK